MKSLKIGIGLLFWVVLGFQLPVSGSAPMGEPQTIAPKNTQGDTVRMKYTNTKYANFSFYGEKGASYKVIWDDGSTDQYTGKGSDSAVFCSHDYSSYGGYNVLLFGVTPEKK